MHHCRSCFLSSNRYDQMYIRQAIRRLVQHFFKPQMKDFSFLVVRHFNSNRHNISDISGCIASCWYGRIEFRHLRNSRSFGTTWNECHVLATAITSSTISNITRFRLLQPQKHFAVEKMFRDVLKAGWTTFSARTTLILCGMNHARFWKYSFDILVHVDLIASHHCYRLICCTFMPWIPHSTTSQRWSIWFRSGDWGGLWSTLKSLPCSRNQFESSFGYYYAKCSHYTIDKLWP